MSEVVAKIEPSPAPLIRNCHFPFRCKQQWESLAATQDSRTRFCDDCQRRVVLCERDDELREALRRNDCVAIPEALLGAGRDKPEIGSYYVGNVDMPPYGP
jgi:hypothetical protein